MFYYYMLTKPFSVYCLAKELKVLKTYPKAFCMLCTLRTSVPVAKSFSLENRSMSMHRKRALSPPLSRYFSCPSFFFCWAFTRKASLWWEKFLGKFFDCRIIWKEVWIAVGSGTRYSCEFSCQLYNSIQFNFIIHTCLYKIFTLYIVR